MAELGEKDRTLIRTTLPIVPSVASRAPVLTTRLLLRPLTTDDVEDLHVIRTQTEVMSWTTIGVPATDLQDTKDYLKERLSNDANFQFSICLRETGEMIGIGGVKGMKGKLGWPTMGYLFRKEAWGKGYATEFVNGFLGAWWALAREPCEIEVDTSTVKGTGDSKEEILIAGVIKGNNASENVLKKTGFQPVKVYEVALRDWGPALTIHDYFVSCPDPK